MKLFQKYYALGTGQGGGSTPPPGPSQNDLDNADELNMSYEEMRNTLRSIGAILKNEITAQLNESNDLAKNIGKSILADINKNLKESQRLIVGLNTGQKSVTKSLNTEQKVREAILKVQENMEDKAALFNELVSEGGVITEEMLAANEELDKVYKSQLGTLQQQLVTVKQVAGITEMWQEGLEKSFTAISKIPIVGSLLNVRKIMDKVGDSAAQGKGKWAQLGAGLKETFKQLTNPVALFSAGITGIFSLFKALFEMTLEFDKKIYELANNLGTSVSQAEKLNSQFMQIAQNSGNLGMQSKDIAKSYGEMNEQLGFMAPVSQDFAGTFALIQKRIGASADQMGVIATQSAISGKSIKSSYAAIIGSAQAEGARNKLQLTQRQILDGIAKVSSAVLVNFKGSVTAVAAAVVRAAKLGTTLEQVNKQSESLLDFETSIQNQFEAEALTGKQLNLEKARSLSLAGDTKGVMKELAKQGMNLTEYENMNVIQREAYAKAVGLSNEELSKQLLMQQQADKLGAKEGESLQQRYKYLLAHGKTQKEIVGLLGESAAADLKKASAAEEFESTIQRLKDLLSEMLRGPVIDIVHQFTAFMNNTKAVHAFGDKIKVVFQQVVGVIKDLPKYLDMAVNVAKVLAAVSIGRAVAAVVGGLSMSGPLGVAAGLVAGAGAYAWLSSLIPGMSSGGSAPSVAGEGTQSESIKPTNYAAQGAAANAVAAKAGNKVVIQTTSNLSVDGKHMATNTTKHLTQDYNATTDSGGSKGTDISQPAAPLYDSGF